MPMESVQLVHGHGVQNLFDLIFIEEMTRHIEHHAAPRETWLILNINARRDPCHARHNPGRINLGRQQLQQRLHAIKRSPLRGRADHHRIGRDRQFIAFRAQGRNGVGGGDQDGSLDGIGRGGSDQLELIAGGFEQRRRQILTGLLRRAINQNLHQGMSRRGRIWLRRHRGQKIPGRFCKVTGKGMMLGAPVFIGPIGGVTVTILCALADTPVALVAIYATRYVPGMFTLTLP